MRRAVIPLVALLFLCVFALVLPSAALAQEPSAADALAQLEALGASITWNGVTDAPGFVTLAVAPPRGSAAAQTAQASAAWFLARYAPAFGVKDVAAELALVETSVDALGYTHLRYLQRAGGRPVLSGELAIHVAQDGRTVVAVSNNVLAVGLISSAPPALAAEDALAIARQALPRAVAAGAPLLQVYPGAGADGQGLLVWSVELRDDAVPARNLYHVDAESGLIVAVDELLTFERNRQTHDAGHRTTLPGALVRSEGDGPTGDRDADSAHDSAGLTYDYFFGSFGRDSYDNAGAALRSTVHYGRNYVNAFWNGEQMTYGDGLATLDVAAHELTHAVTEHTAGLEYRWQSGALNESISDIFATMVDRDEWLIGNEIPAYLLAGREAMRDLQNPERFGQPAHVDDWVESCEDNEGVHTNSGIFNRAYYELATRIGKEDAERALYRALTVYLSPNSSLKVARAAVLTSLSDLFGHGGEYTHGVVAFDVVGLDSEWDPEENDCSCALSTALALQGDQAAAVEQTPALYRVRDELFATSAAGATYRSFYDHWTGEASRVIGAHPELAADAGEALAGLLPGLNALMSGRGAEVAVTPEVIALSTGFMHDLAAAARADGDANLADAIERELSLIRWDSFTGKSFSQVWSEVQVQRLAAQSTFLPLVQVAP